MGPASDSGAGGHVGGENVVGMPVEVLLCAVVAQGRAGSAWRAAICTSRRSTPASSMVVTKVPVVRNLDNYETFERMHWAHFHSSGDLSTGSIDVALICLRFSPRQPPRSGLGH